MKVHIEAPSGSGYLMQLHEDPPPNFTTHFRVQLDELNYYSESDGDVILIVQSQALTWEIVPQDDPRTFELTFSGTVEIDIDAGKIDEFRTTSQASGVDYCIALLSEDDEQYWCSGDDWVFLQNRNLIPEFPADR